MDPCGTPNSRYLGGNIVSPMITLWERHSKKLTLYYKIKTNYSPSAYLDLRRKNPSRKTLVKLRISSHKLRIEKGRYGNIPRDL